MGGVVAALLGAGLGTVVAVGGVTTYQAVSTDTTQQVDPNNVGYADE